ncbi:AbrB/MazE/SpoVT family DNA-binding domain-containing protein [Streptacidiphilus sp. PAMC 29251]
MLQGAGDPAAAILRGLIRTPAELTIGDDGPVIIPMSLLAEAGLDVGSRVLAYSGGDGRIVLRREDDAVQELSERGTLS